MKFLNRAGLALAFVVICGSCAEPPPMPLEDNEIETIRPKSEILSDLRSEDKQKVSNAILEAMRLEDSSGVGKELILVHKKHKDDSIRLTAAMALAHFKVKEAAPLVSAQLAANRSSSPDLLIDALGQLGDSRYADSIVVYLKHENHTYRLKAVEALERLKARNAGPKILTMARGEKREDFVKTYAMALGKIAYGPAETWLLQKLPQTTEGPDRAAVLLALGRVKSKKAVPALVKAIESNFEKGRENSALSLIEIGGITSHALLTQAFERTAGESDKDTDIRQKISDVLAAYPHDSTSKKIHEIFLKSRGLQSSDTALLLGKLKYIASTHEIIKRLENTANIGREDLAKALGYMGDLKTEPVILKVLSETEGKGRYGAMWSAGVLKLKSAVPQLRKLVSDSDQYAARLAIEALGAMQDAAALPELRKSLERDAGMAVYAASAIALIEGEQAREILLDNTGRGEIARRKACLEALAMRKDKSTVIPLVKMLQKAEPELRPNFYYALQAITGENFRSASRWDQYAQQLK